MLSAPGAILLDACCGDGAASLPLVAAFPALSLVAVDHASKCLELVQRHEEWAEARCTAVEADVSTDAAARALRGVGAAACLLVFGLSAMRAARWPAALRACAAGLREGGAVFVRDFAVADDTMLRGRHTKLAAGEYARADGTLVTYLLRESLAAAAGEAGLTVAWSAYHCVLQKNRKTGVQQRKMFVMARLTKSCGSG